MQQRSHLLTFLLNSTMLGSAQRTLFFLYYPNSRTLPYQPSVPPDVTSLETTISLLLTHLVAFCLLVSGRPALFPYLAAHNSLFSSWRTQIRLCHIVTIWPHFLLTDSFQLRHARLRLSHYLQTPAESDPHVKGVRKLARPSVLCSQSLRKSLLLTACQVVLVNLLITQLPLNLKLWTPCHPGYQ